jgi:hypothetical protein
VAVAVAEVEFSGTVTVAGTVTSGLLLVRFTVSPPAGAAALSVTVQETLVIPFVVVLVQENALNEPVRLTPVPDVPPADSVFASFDAVQPDSPMNRQKDRMTDGITSQWLLRRV